MEPDYEATLRRARREATRRRAREWVAGCEFAGESLGEFCERARAQGFVVRVLPEPGSHVLLTADRRANRINVRVADGVVTEVDGVY